MTADIEAFLYLTFLALAVAEHRARLWVHVCGFLKSRGGGRAMVVELNRWLARRRFTNSFYDFAVIRTVAVIAMPPPELSRGSFPDFYACFSAETAL